MTVSTIEEFDSKDLKGSITNLLRLCNHIITKYNGDSAPQMRKSKKTRKCNSDGFFLSQNNDSQSKTCNAPVFNDEGIK